MSSPIVNDDTPKDPLAECRQKGGLAHPGWSIEYVDGANLVELNGGFSVDELEAVARYMRAKGATPDGA
jgi:hypothetical protein